MEFNKYDDSAHLLVGQVCVPVAGSDGDGLSGWRDHVVVVASDVRLDRESWFVAAYRKSESVNQVAKLGRSGRVV